MRTTRGGSCKRRILGALGLLLVVCHPAAAEPSTASDEVVIQGERMSLHADRVPLTELLERINRSGVATVDVYGDLSGLSASVFYQDVDLRTALRRIFSDRSYIMIDEVDAATGRSIRLFLLGDRDGPHRVVGEDPTPLNEDSRLEQRYVEDLAYSAQSASSAEDRAASVDAIAYATGGDSTTEDFAMQVLTQSLADPDEQVREQALETIKDTAGEVPTDHLVRVAREDVQAQLRVQALELLVERTGEQARESLRTALTDPDPLVHERARELIDDLHIELDAS